jgi:hypothetical protein
LILLKPKLKSQGHWMLSLRKSRSAGIPSQRPFNNLLRLLQAAGGVAEVDVGEVEDAEVDLTTQDISSLVTGSAPLSCLIPWKMVRWG